MTETSATSALDFVDAPGSILAVALSIQACSGSHFRPTKRSISKYSIRLSGNSLSTNVADRRVIPCGKRNIGSRCSEF